MQRHPNCPHEPEHCRVSRRHRVATLISWEPTYDGNGTLTNADPNTFVDEYSCGTCQGEWTETRTGEQVSVEVFREPLGLGRPLPA